MKKMPVTGAQVFPYWERGRRVTGISTILVKYAHEPAQHLGRSLRK